MDLFRTYSRDYKDIIDEVKTKISQSETLEPDERKAKLREAETALKDAEDITNSMSLATRSVSPAQADEMSKEINRFRQELKNVKRDLKTAKETFDRHSLIGGTDEVAITSLEQRQAMKNDTARLNEAGGVLKSAIQEGESAYQTGVSTLTVLHGQRSQIEGARENLGLVRGLIKDSERIMRGIWSNMMGEDFIKVVIIIVLLMFIVLVIYLRFIRKPDNTPPFTPFNPIDMAPMPTAPAAPTVPYFDEPISNTS